MLLVEPPSGLASLSHATGIVVMDRARRIVFKNPSAAALLSGGMPPGEHGRRVTTRSGDMQAQVQAALAVAVAGPQGDAAPRLLSVRRPHGLPLIGLVVSLSGVGDGDLASLALLWDPQAAPLLPNNVLAQLFGLTPAETQIAMATYEGHTPAEVAFARGRSVATVRTLLSRAFMKCGVRRQAELVKLLAGIANACSLAEGIRVGLDLRHDTPADLYRRAAVLHLSQVVTHELSQTKDMIATVHEKELAPGQTTMPHYHTHGHEVLCVLRGELTTEFDDREPGRTAAGQTRYVQEGVVHRGANQATSGCVQILSINVARRGGTFRVEQPNMARRAEFVNMR